LRVGRPYQGIESSNLKNRLVLAVSESVTVASTVGLPDSATLKAPPGVAAVAAPETLLAMSSQVSAFKLDEASTV
jgi:hypothetical protein